MNKDFQNAIEELNNNVETLLANNEKELNALKTKITKGEKNMPLPLSENLENNCDQKCNFSDYIRKGIDSFLKKSLNGVNGNEGGHFVPEKIAMQIGDRLKFLSPMRSIAKITTISTNSLDMLVDSKDPGAGWVSAETTSRDETNSPEIQKIKIPVHEIYAKPKASQRLLDDAQINVEEWLINKIAEKIAALENYAFTNGDGDDKPKGFLHYTSEPSSIREFGKLQHFCSGADGKFSVDNNPIDILLNMVCSLKPIYVKNAQWLMSRSAFAEIRKLKNSDGTCLWQPSLSESTPSTLLGYPVIINEDMPNLVSGTASVSVAFGDFHSGYQIVDRQGLKILRDPYTSKPFVEFYATKRTGGAIVDFDALKLLKFSIN
ncbi:MAG: phage major capsid protein [Holosporaceae bacterium]|jgi:HK97 family phage major capsid protein|nr:phage major capsid protein [Holosporaceae bacterium]